MNFFKYICSLQSQEKKKKNLVKKHNRNMRSVKITFPHLSLIIKSSFWFFFFFPSKSGLGSWCRPFSLYSKCFTFFFFLIFRWGCAFFPLHFFLWNLLLKEFSISSGTRDEQFDSWRQKKVLRCHPQHHHHHHWQHNSLSHQRQLQRQHNRWVGNGWWWQWL